MINKLKKNKEDKVIIAKVVKPKKEKLPKVIKEKKIAVASKKAIDTRKKRIKGDPESRGKSELEIENEICNFLDALPACVWWKTKNKGEVHSVGGKTIRKKGANPGFQDITICFRGIFIAVEVKSGDGGYQSGDQIDQQEKIQKKGGGFYFIVTSVRELAMLMIACGLLKEKMKGDGQENPMLLLEE